MSNQHSRSRRIGQLSLTFLIGGGLISALSALPWLLGHGGALSFDVLGPITAAIAWGLLGAAEEYTQPWPPRVDKGEDTPWRKVATFGLWGLLPISSWDARFSLLPFTGGAFLLAGGMALRIWSLHELGPLFTWHAGVTGNHKVIRSGPYRYMKHPNYVGNVLLAAGIVLTCGSRAGWYIFILTATAIILTARHEEVVLKRHLPGYQ